MRRTCTGHLFHIRYNSVNLGLPNPSDFKAYQLGRLVLHTTPDRVTYSHTHASLSCMHGQREHAEAWETRIQVVFLFNNENAYNAIEYHLPIVYNKVPYS